MSFSGLQADARKGDPHHLRGKLIAFVRIETDEDADSNPVSQQEGEEVSPLQGLVRNGILAVQAN